MRSGVSPGTAVALAGAGEAVGAIVVGVGPPLHAARPKRNVATRVRSVFTGYVASADWILNSGKLITTAFPCSTETQGESNTHENMTLRESYSLGDRTVHKTADWGAIHSNLHGYNERGFAGIKHLCWRKSRHRGRKSVTISGPPVGTMLQRFGSRCKRLLCQRRGKREVCSMSIFHWYGRRVFRGCCDVQTIWGVATGSSCSSQKLTKLLRNSCTTLSDYCRGIEHSGGMLSLRL